MIVNTGSSDTTPNAKRIEEMLDSQGDGTARRLR